VPTIDEGVRRRLTLRFGSAVNAWFDKLPSALDGLSRQWQLALGQPFSRGSVAAVYRCQRSNGQPAVLKIGPDHARMAVEAAVLQVWNSPHSPAVLAHDAELGALLLEAIEPGTPLVDTTTYPGLETIAALLRALHAFGVRQGTFPGVDQRVRYLFESSTKLYQQDPELAAVVSRALYERGWQLAARLAEPSSQPVLLHGDLTPSNILDGGARGLVAIDPAPCIGDAGFDAIDLILWQADDVATIDARIDTLAGLAALDAQRVHDWCVAFAAMSALELASEPNHSPSRREAFLELASRASPRSRVARPS